MQETEEQKESITEREPKGSTIQMPGPNNSGNVGKKPFRKKMMRLLGSIMPKKRKTNFISTQNNDSFSVNGHELSYFDSEKGQHRLMESQEKLLTLVEPEKEILDDKHLDLTISSETSKHDLATGPYQVVNVYSQPSQSVVVDSIENMFSSIDQVTSHINPDSELSNMCNQQKLEISKAHEEVLIVKNFSGFRLEEKQAMPYLTALPQTSGLLEIDDKPDQSQDHRSNTENGLGCIKDKCKNINNDITLNNETIKQSTDTQSTEIIQSIFSELLQDMDHDKIQILNNQKSSEATSIFLENNYNSSKFPINDVNFQTPQKLLQKVLEMEIKNNLTDQTKNIALNKKINSPKNNYDILQKEKFHSKDNCVAKKAPVANGLMENIRVVHNTNILNGVKEEKELDETPDFSYLDKQELYECKESTLNYCLKETLTKKCASPENKMSLVSNSFLKNLTMENINFNMLRNYLSVDNNTRPRQRDVLDKDENIMNLVDNFPNSKHMPFFDDEMKSKHNQEQQLHKKNNLVLVSSEKTDYSPENSIKLSRDHLIYPKLSSKEITDIHFKSYSSNNQKQTHIGCISNQNQTTELTYEKTKPCRQISNGSISKTDINYSYEDRKEENAHHLSKTVAGSQFTSIISEATSKDILKADMQEKNSDTRCSRLVKMLDNSESESSRSISNLIFSSPNIKLNLTNPLMKK